MGRRKTFTLPNQHPASNRTSSCVEQGKDLYLNLDDHNLTLTDTADLTVLNTQPIQTIRVWGVGRDNGRCVNSVR